MVLAFSVKIWGDKIQILSRNPGRVFITKNMKIFILSFSIRQECSYSTFLLCSILTQVKCNWQPSLNVFIYEDNPQILQLKFLVHVTNMYFLYQKHFLLSRWTTQSYINGKLPTHRTKPFTDYLAGYTSISSSGIPIRTMFVTAKRPVYTQHHIT